MDSGSNSQKYNNMPTLFHIQAYSTVLLWIAANAISCKIWILYRSADFPICGDLWIIIWINEVEDLLYWWEISNMDCFSEKSTVVVGAFGARSVPFQIGNESLRNKSCFGWWYTLGLILFFLPRFVKSAFITKGRSLCLMPFRTQPWRDLSTSGIEPGIFLLVKCKPPHYKATYQMKHLLDF